MVLGYSTNAFVKFSLADAIERIAGLGFAGVEIMGDRPHLFPPDYDTAGLAALRSIIEANRLTVTNLNSFTLFAVGDTYLPSWIETEPQRRSIRIQHTMDSLKVAQYLGCDNISVPPGGPLESGMTRKEAYRLFQEGLEQVLPLAQELDTRVLIEPEPELLLENTPEFKSFIKNFRTPHLGLNFDIGHFFCAGEEPAESFETLFDYIGHVHIEDIAPTRVHAHLIAGHGAIDFPRIFEAMARLDYRGHISLELYPYVDTPEEAGSESLQHLRPLMQAAGLDIAV